MRRGALVTLLLLPVALLAAWVAFRTRDGGGDPAASAPSGAGRAPLRRPREAPKADPPAGMVYVPPGTARLGTAEEDLAALAEGRDEATKARLAFEAPAHTREVPGFFLDAAEVTNAQYLVFLRDACLSFAEVVEGGPSDLPGLAGEAVGAPPERRAGDDHAWRVLYRENRNALWEVLPDRVVRREGGGVDEAATEERFRDAPLRPGLRLLAYRRLAPRDWPGPEPRPEEADLPVRWVSFQDAEAFAEWAGKHVPTEAEWEYACRGPEGRTFPWGDAWDAGRVHLAPREEGALPRLAAATGEPADSPSEAGRSWVGARHLLGNVAEWTSSWFDAYPGAPAGRTHAFAGRYAKVIRGGSLLDADALALRGAARDFIGRGPEAPPLPQNRFEWVGFRCAKHPEPGLDLARHAARRLAAGRVVGEADLDLDGIAGVEVNRYAPPGTATPDGVTVLARCPGFAVVPLRRVVPAVPEGTPAEVFGRLAETSERDAVLLAGIHAGLPLGGEGVEKRGLEGDWRAGSLFLGLLRGRLALLTEEGDAVLWLSPAGGDTGITAAVRRPDESLPDTVLRVVPQREELELDVSVPVGERGDGSAYVRLRRRLLVWPGALGEAAGAPR